MKYNDVVNHGAEIVQKFRRETSLISRIVGVVRLQLEGEGNYE